MSRAPETSDSAIDRLLKLLPAESTGAFLILRTQFPYERSTEDFIAASITFYLLAILIVIATPFLLSRVWGETNRFIIGFITASFVIWALNIDIQRTIHLAEYFKIKDLPLLPYLLNDQFISGLMVVWALVLIPLALPPKVNRTDSESNQSDSNED